MMLLPITAFTIALCALLTVFLAYRISVFRRKHLVGIGMSKVTELSVAVRAHGNLVEHAPTAILLLLVNELMHGSLWYFWVFAVGFVATRCLHAYGLTKTQGGTSFGRFHGTLFSWILIFSLAIYTVIFSVVLPLSA